MASSDVTAQARQCADLYREYAPALRRFFARRAHPSIIEDLLQDVFRNLQARREPEAVADMQRYLFVVAANVLARHHRRTAPFDPLPENDLLRELQDEISPERVLLARQRLGAAMAAIQRLPERTRSIFLLHRFEEMSYQRIARELGISVSAVEKHMMAALRAVLREAGEPR